MRLLFLLAISCVGFTASLASLENFIIFAVDARKLDYSDCSRLLKTMAKHPSDGSKNSDVGHAWIYLKQGDSILQGGHSAERGIL